MKKSLLPLSIFALAASHASAISILSEDFQTPGIANGTAAPAFSGWSYVSGSNVKLRTSGGTADVPDDTSFATNANQALQFEWTSAQAHYDLGHSWAADNVYDMSINVAPQAWNLPNARTLTLKLVQTSDNTEVWAGTASPPNPTGYAWNGPGLYGTDAWQDHPGSLYSFVIDASTFTVGAAGENLRLEIVSGGQRGIYFDNVNLDLRVVAIPEPSSSALVGLAGLALALRRRR